MITTPRRHTGPKPQTSFLPEFSAAFYRNTGWVLLSIMLVMLGLPGTAAAVEKDASERFPRDPMEYFFHQSFNNLEEELEIAAEENKSGIFIMFSDKDCPWCLKMKSTVLNRVEVQDYYRQHFRILMIDIRGDTMMTDFEGNEVYEKDFAFKQQRVRATPVFIFFDTSGNKTMRFTGIVRDAREFLWLGEFVVNGDYKKTNFTKYKRERAEQEKAAAQKQPG